MNTHVRDQFLETAPGKASAAGQQFRATAANSIEAFAGAVYLAADQTTTGSYADMLSWTIGANDIWAFNGVFWFTVTGSGTANSVWTLPASCTLFWQNYENIRAMNTASKTTASATLIPQQTSNNTTDMNLVATGAEGSVMVSGLLYGGGTGGSVAMRVKTNTGTSVTFKKGSHLILTKLG